MEKMQFENLQEKSELLFAIRNKNANGYTYRIEGCEQDGTLHNYCKGQCDICPCVVVYKGV